MEDWLALSITGDGLGHFSADCVARDQSGIGNKLAFKLTFDQTELPGMLRELDELLRLFPVRGGGDQHRNFVPLPEPAEPAIWEGPPRAAAAGGEHGWGVGNTDF